MYTDGFSKARPRQALSALCLRAPKPTATSALASPTQYGARNYHNSMIARTVTTTLAAFSSRKDFSASVANTIPMDRNTVKDASHSWLPPVIQSEQHWNHPGSAGCLMHAASSSPKMFFRQTIAGMVYGCMHDHAWMHVRVSNLCLLLTRYTMALTTPGLSNK